MNQAKNSGRLARLLPVVTASLVCGFVWGLVGCQQREIHREGEGFDALENAPVSTSDSTNTPTSTQRGGSAHQLVGVISTGVTLLEHHQYDAFRKTVFRPEDRDADLAPAAADQLLRALIAVRDSRAAASLPPGSKQFRVRNRASGYGTLVFEKIDGYWYLQRPEE